MHLDPRGTQYIPANLLLPLLRAVQYPLGIRGARTCCDLIDCCCHVPPAPLSRIPDLIRFTHLMRPTRLSHHSL